jgi:hypothetical protein
MVNPIQIIQVRSFRLYKIECFVIECLEQQPFDKLLQLTFQSKPFNNKNPAFEELRYSVLRNAGIYFM